MKKRLFAVSLFFCLPLSVSISHSEPDIEWGGELRFRPEMSNNKDFNSDKPDNKAFIGQRVRISATVKKDEKFRAFVQIQDSRQWGSVSNTGTAINENKAAAGKSHENLDLYQAYLEIKNVSHPALSLKIGRQTLVYGDQRLLGHLGWTDQARSFDATKAVYSREKVKSDIFFAKLNEKGKPSDSMNDQDLWGVYNTFNYIPDHDVDIYYLYWKDDTSRKISTWGGRIKGKSMDILDYTGEVTFQTGEWSKSVDQKSMAYAVKVGINFDSPITRVGIELDHGSGDGDSTDNKNSTFIFPFHTNHAHYGYMDFFSWANMNDLRVQLNGKASSLKWQLDYHYLTLANGMGEWFKVDGVNVFKSATPGKESTDAGQEVDFTVKYIHSKNFKVVGGYSIFLPGEAAKERFGQDDNATWGYLLSQFTF